MKNKKILILADGFFYWNGGFDFIVFLIEGLKRIDNIEIYILIPDNNTFFNQFKYFLKKKILLTLKWVSFGIINRPLPQKPHQLDNLLQLGKSIDGVNQLIVYKNTKSSLIEVCESLDNAIIFPSFFDLGVNFPIPWIGYIYDFQHKYLPDTFSEKEVKYRDDTFNNIVSNSSAVIVNSKQVKKDVFTFLKNEKNIIALPFTPIFNYGYFKQLSPVITTIEKYNLPVKYFAVCNQFWLHKDHSVVFKALKILSEKYELNDIHIVCTGHMEDYRNPIYIKNLQILIESIGQKDKIHFVGLVPKLDQINIMINSIAVIQPTLFEGGPGGGSIYESIAYGVRNIISDIPINLEIEDSLTTFFKASDENDLARQMCKLLLEPFLKIDEEELIIKSKSKIKLFSGSLQEIINKF